MHMIYSEVFKIALPHTPLHFTPLAALNSRLNPENEAAGASIPPEAMMHFPLFQILPYFRFFLDSVEIFPILPFPKKFLDFHPPKFLMTFFRH